MGRPNELIMQRPVEQSVEAKLDPEQAVKELWSEPLKVGVLTRVHQWMAECEPLPVEDREHRHECPEANLDESSEPLREPPRTVCPEHPKADRGHEADGLVANPRDQAEEQAEHQRRAGTAKQQVNEQQTWCQDQDIGIEAVDAARTGGGGNGDDKVALDWTPQINLGLEVRIPESYVTDLSVRLSLYRRIANLASEEDTDMLLAELVDRFGKLPASVRNLFAIITLKQLCKLANVEKIDAGPKGLAIGFRENQFARPDQLIGWIADQNGCVQLRADHKLIVKQTLPAPDLRPQICTELLEEMVALLA